MRGKITAAAAALVAAAGIAGAGAASAASPAVPTATPIRFAAGTSSAHVSGHVAAHGDRRYTFSARAGQTATFHLSRSTSAMTWTLVGPTGPSVHDAHSPRQSDFTYRLPTTGTYYLDIVSSRAASYGLSLAIPAGPAATTAEQEIRFPAGATGTTVTGTVPSTGTARYRLVAARGQHAAITFEDSAENATWTFVSPGGSPLHNGMTEQQRRATVTLPETGTYWLAVSSPAGSTYALTVSIPPR